MIKKKKVIDLTETGPEGYHDVPKNDIERYLVSVLPKVTNAYGLGKIGYFFETSTKQGATEENGEILFAINYRSTYKLAYIEISPLAVEMMRDGDRQTLLRGIIHEIAHIVTSSLSNVAEARFVERREIINAIEETTESVAQIARTLLKKTDPQLFN